MEYRLLFENAVAASRTLNVIDEATKNNLKIAIARVRELEGQVARLKVTAERISDIRAIIEKPAVMIQPQA